MFDSVGWGEIFILIVAGLVILGPERLPGAISWTMQSLRKVREYATGATDQLKNDFGTDFDDLRKPLADLNELRGMTPKSMITKHLLDGDDSVFKTFTDAGSVLKSATDTPPIKPVSKPMPDGPVGEPGPSLRKPSAADSSEHRPARGHHDVSDWDAT
ncbi:sec-independent protein translocase protein TatB [Gordonia polyisoprenivorans VH2]|uniref:Sec-independent protein translocase protein TatB n=1 Tax=Gordonia polyisoprenivorans (strain DSM 44266 / VH2) TaxID=1112204 RepID=H6MV92_GORPV|nr:MULTISPECIES: Sec-independent protein translocase protein TatB [Gordonia]AFA72799.1 sec-independent protein translocase protein TatB [Gordonia polyisoprenivorans VH2]MDF3284826.1 Sec-independent protein translocase protein TatB [Gordonia sp. N1V]OPX16040.1 twin arginine-targeting protein translocase TatB [Gordonia sp. i37]QTI71265.1 Sec-independent protein translocase subunit TatB [Gordonia polyisoprenivorans]